MQRNLLVEALVVGALLAAAYWLVCQFIQPGLTAVAIAGALSHILLEVSGGNAAFCQYASYPTA